MAVSFLCMANDGTAGRKRGSIRGVQEHLDGTAPKFGRREKSPNYFIVTVSGIDFAMVDPKYFAYGSHRSRMTIVPERLPVAAQADLAAGKRPILTVVNLNTAVKDEGVDWRGAVAIGP